MQSLCGLAIECSGFLVFSGNEKRQDGGCKKQFKKQNQKIFFPPFTLLRKIQKFRNILFNYSGPCKKFTIRKHARDFSMFRAVCFFQSFWFPAFDE
jgi:hypothetical protein